MSVDPSTLTQKNINPPINSWDTKWNNTMATNITSPKQLETQCMETKCEIATDECECIKRIIFIMKFYSIWINVNVNIDNNDINNDYLSVSFSAFVMNLKYYSIIQLTNDWLHLRQVHWTDISIQYNTRNIFESIIGKCDELEKCSIFARVNRDREKFKNNEIRKRLYFINNDKRNESTEVTTQQLCDSMHDCIFHAPIIFLPKLYVPPPTTTHSEAPNHIVEESKDSNTDQKYDHDSLCIDVEDCDDEEWDMDASEVSMLRLLSPTLNASKGFSARKSAVAKLKNTNSKYFQHSKFVTSVANHVEPPNNVDLINKFNAPLTDNEATEEKQIIISKQPSLNKAMSTNLTNSIGSYEFGIELMYSQHFQKHAKWSTMKDETLKHEDEKYCISMHQWSDTIKKAQHWMQCIRGKALTARNNDKNMNIHIGDALNVATIVSCLLYTNFTDLQRRFSGSTRRYNWQQNETDDDIRIKHYRDYYHWGKTLMVFIYCFGDLMNEKLSLYHGISIQLLFGEFTAYFNCPTSTTISLSIASSFASGGGIILKLSGRGQKTKTKFIDVSWFSDYPQEEERLFYGQHNELEIRSIFHGNFDYKRFIRAIKVLDILTDPPTFIVRQGGKRYAKLNEAKYYNHLLSMIKNFIETETYKKEIQQQKNDKKLKKKHWTTKEIPSNYLQNIFNHFCELQTVISIDCLRFAALLTHKDKKHELAKYFLIKQHAVYEQFVYCLNIPILIRLFPKVKFLRLGFGGKPLQTEQFEYCCKHIAAFLNHINKNKQKPHSTELETVTLSGLLNSRYKYVSKDVIRQIRKKYFSNTRCKLHFDKKSVQFTLFAKQKIPFYENIFVGNLHHIETPKPTKSKRNKRKYAKNRNIQMRKNRKKKKLKDMHVWTMFLSTSKQKLVKPKTIKQVVYYLDTKIFKNSEYSFKKSPFILRQKGEKTFKVNVKVIFRGKRKNLHFVHLLDFDHAVTITAAHFIVDRSKRKDTKNDVCHSSDYQAFDYYNIHNL